VTHSTAPEKPGNWHAAVLYCQLGPTASVRDDGTPYLPDAHSCVPACDHRCTTTGCRGRYDLGIVDFWHPNPLRMLWWKSVLLPRAHRRVNRWNAHVADRLADQLED
jgi:hypothetical protein